MLLDGNGEKNPKNNHLDTKKAIINISKILKVSCVKRKEEKV